MHLQRHFWFLLLSISALCSLVGQTTQPPQLSGVNGGGAVDPGQRVVLNPVFSSGSSSVGLQFQWRKNGSDLAGQTNSSLVIDPVTAADAGTFTVVASNSAGSAAAATELSVRAPAAPVIITQPRAATVDAGQSAVFNFVATGAFPRTYQWRKDGVAITGATNATLSLVGVTSADVGAYSVQISNSIGATVSTPAALTVNAARPPVLASFPANQDPFVQGRNYILPAPVNNGSTPMNYQWRKGGVPIAGATAATLTFDGIELNDAGRYSVVVSNIAGTATSGEVEITVQPAPPAFRIRLRSQTALLGGSLTLEDTSSLFEQQPTLYQWYKDGKAIPQATQLRYAIDRVTPAAAGTYFVVASNVAGATTSDTAVVSVLATNGPFNAPWLAAERSGDVVYFVFASPARLERFDLAGDRWLPAVPLARTPTAFTILNGNLYFGFGPVVSRIAPDGSGETSVTPGFNHDVRGLAGWNGYLFVSDGNGQVTSVRLSDGAKVSSLGFSTSLYFPVAVAASTGVIYGRNSSHSGSLFSLKVQPNGSLQPDFSGSNLGALPYGERLFLSPDEARLFTEQGRVFRTADRDLIGSVGGRIDDVDFTTAGEAVVLRGATVHILGRDLYETRQLTVSGTGQRLFVRGGDVFVFGAVESGGQPAKVRASLAQAQTLPEVAPRSAERVGFTPDAVLLDRDGVVLLYSKLHQQIFRWSTTARRYLSSLPLRGWPNRVVYSPTLHRIYLAHPDNRVSQIRLDAGMTTEEPFVTVPQQALSLASAGDYVLVDFSDSNFSSVTRLSFGADGRQIYLGSGFSREYTWSQPRRRLYHFSDHTSPNDLLSTEIKADGTAGERRDSPYHGSIVIRYPIRVSPDGNVVLLGSGKFFDGSTLAVINSLPHEIDEATWLGDRVVTGRATARGIELQRWGGVNFDLQRSAVLPGRLISLHTLPGDRVLAVTVMKGLVYFTVVDAELGVLNTDFGGAPQQLANLSSRAVVGRGDQILIPGFVIAGSDPKTVLIRAVGPALSELGVAGALGDPTFSVHNAAGAIVATNDNWAAATNTALLNTVTTRVGAFALGRGSRDAAALVTLDPGSYTVQVRGVGDGTGVGLVEVYDPQDNAGSSRLINIATRAVVGRDGDILIAGLVVQGDAPKSVLVRAIGPTLSAFSVGGVLADPRLRVFREGTVIAENGDWGENGAGAAAEIAAAAARAGAFALPAGTRDSALLLALPAGSYSVQVSGADGGTGVALVEVYEVP